MDLRFYGVFDVFIGNSMGSGLCDVGFLSKKCWIIVIGFFFIIGLEIDVLF